MVIKRHGFLVLENRVGRRLCPGCRQPLPGLGRASGHGTAVRPLL